MDAEIGTDCTPIYFVADSNLENLRAKFTKVARRAANLGLTPPQLITHAKYDQVRVRTNEITGRKETILTPRTVCTVEGVSPVINGWTMVAAVEHIERETLIHAFDKTVDLTAYRGSDATHGCDHCNTRRYRASTFVLRHENGAMRRIGRNCLVDFIGSPDAIKWFTAAAEMLSSAIGACESEDGEGGFGGRGERVEELPKLLAWVWSSVRTFGWTSRKAAQGSFEPKMSTIDRVLATWYAGNMKAHERVPQPTEQDFARAAETIEFVQANTEDSEYAENLRVISRMEYVREKHMGLAASMVVVYDRELTKRAEAAKRGPSSHVGTIGDRMVMTLTLTKVSYSEGDYGLTTIARFTDENSNDFVWFASGEVPWLHVSAEEIAHGTFTAKETGDVKVGTSFTVKATVKKHQTNKYNNRPETVLSRVALYTPPAPKVRKPRAKKSTEASC